MTQEQIRKRLREVKEEMAMKQEKMSSKEDEIMTGEVQDAVMCESEEVNAELEGTVADEQEAVGKSESDEKIEVTADGEEAKQDDAGEILDQELDVTQQTQAPAVKELSELAASLQGDFPVYIPKIISRQEKYEIFEGSENLKEYISQTNKQMPSLKIWSEINNSGEMQVLYAFRAGGACQSKYGMIQRRQLFPEVKSCLDFLWDFQGMDATIIQGAYNVIKKIAPKLEESVELADDAMGFEETYAMMIQNVQNRIQNAQNQNATIQKSLDFKSKRINDVDFVCIRGKDALDSVLKDIGASMKKLELLRKLRDPEEGMSFLIINEGRMYDHRGEGDFGSWWYYIRIDEDIMSEFINDEEKEEEKYA